MNMKAIQPLVRLSVIAWLGLALGGTTPVMAQTLPTLTLDANGAIHADGLVIPESSFFSAEAHAQQTLELSKGLPPNAAATGVAIARAQSDVGQKAILAKWLAIYPSDIQPMMIGGVQTDVVTPKSGIAAENQNRVLINLHGGGFSAGARSGGQAESVPVAGRGRIKVVAVDYRLAPENLFPAASEDVEKVYVALLKTYKPENIGIYGCSAGGTLTGQVVAWLQHKKLPRPAVVGVFCSGLMPTFWFGGDSGSLAPTLNNQPPQTMPSKPPPGAPRFYLAGMDDKDPLITPGLFPEVLAKFPPTLIVTGTRDVSESNALVTNVKLLQAGVETQLLVLEGLGHGQFNAFAGTPEAADAYDIIWRFFDRHLGH